MKYCLVENSLVVNVVVWDGVSHVDFGKVDVVAVPDDVCVGPGFTYNGSEFIPPQEESI